MMARRLKIQTGRTESESGEEPVDSRNLSFSSYIQALDRYMRDYYRLTEEYFANCRELCRSCTFDKAMAHYSILVNQLKQDSFTERQKRGQNYSR